MKITKTKMSIIILLILNINAFAQNHKSIVEGVLTGKTDGLLVLSFNYNDYDTVRLVNGKFRFEKSVEKSKAYILHFYSGSTGFLGLYLFISPNDTIYINAKVKEEKKKINFYEKDTTILMYRFVDYQIKGGKYMKDFTWHDEARSTVRNEIIYKKWNKAKRNGDTISMNKLENEILKPTLDYVNENPKSELSAYFLYDLKELINKDSLIHYLSELDSSLSNYYYNVEAQYYINYKDKQKEMPLNTLVKGEQLPALDIKLINGSSLKLDSLKDKLVIMDFWGSWCGPCLRDLPHMKGFYEKYRQNGIEFIGVACRDSLESAASIIDKYGLKWPQAINSDQKEDIALKLGIRNYPTKIIVGRDGKIIDIIVGLSEETLNSIEKILSKQ